MIWHKLVPSDKLAADSVVEGEFKGEDLLLWRLQDGSCAAISAYCPHMKYYIPNGLAAGKPLSELVLDDEIVCPFHGWRFNSVGVCPAIPAGQPVPKKIARGEPVIRSWNVREQDGWIEIY